MLDLLQRLSLSEGCPKRSVFGQAANTCSKISLNDYRTCLQFRTPISLQETALCRLTYLCCDGPTTPAGRGDADQATSEIHVAEVVGCLDSHAEHADPRGDRQRAKAQRIGNELDLGYFCPTPRKGKTSPAPCFVRCATSYRKRKSGHGRVRNGTVSVMRRWGCTKVSSIDFGR